MKGALSGSAILFTVALALGLAALSATGTTSASPPGNPAGSTTLYPVADTWVNYFLPNNNYGTTTQLRVGSSECPG